KKQAAGREVRNALNTRRSPDVAQKKVSSHDERRRTLESWAGQIGVSIAALQGPLAHDTDVALAAERDLIWAEAQDAIKRFDAELKQFLAERAPGLAAAQATCESCANHRQARLALAAVA